MLFHLNLLYKELFFIPLISFHYRLIFYIFFNYILLSAFSSFGEASTKYDNYSLPQIEILKPSNFQVITPSIYSGSWVKHLSQLDFNVNEDTQNRNQMIIREQEALSNNRDKMLDDVNQDLQHKHLHKITLEMYSVWGRITLNFYYYYSLEKLVFLFWQTFCRF